MQLQSFIYCKISKVSKALPKVIQMTMHCSRSPLWRNTVGLCEVQSRIYVVNRWKYYPDYFPDPLALSELVSWRRAHACIFQTHTSPETWHVAICDECRRDPMSVRLSCRKPVVWSGNIWIRNERISQRGLYCLRLVFFIVLLSFTACRRKRFLWAMANKVNITWQVKVKWLQKCYWFWGFKVKSCLTLCRPILGNELAEITQNRTKCYHFILGKWVNNWKQGNWYDN